jgi:hypothetical protein
LESFLGIPRAAAEILTLHKGSNQIELRLVCRVVSLVDLGR